MHDLFWTGLFLHLVEEQFRKQLFDSCKRLAYHYAYKYYNISDRKGDPDDLISVCLEALMKAARGYDWNYNVKKGAQKGKGVKFTSYCVRIIQSEIYKHFNPSNQKQFEDDMLHYMVGRYRREGDDNYEEPLDVKTQEEKHKYPIEPEQIFSYVEKLDDRKKLVIYSVYVHQLTYGQIGEQLNLTKERVRQILNDALAEIAVKVGCTSRKQESLRERRKRYKLYREKKRKQAVA